MGALGRPGLGMTTSGCTQVSTDLGHFSVLPDVKHFSPEEIAVKVVGDHVGSSCASRERSVSPLAGASQNE